MSALKYLLLASALQLCRCEHEACKTVVWLAHNKKDQPKSCWNWTDGVWFGGASEAEPQWPLAKHPGHADTPAVTGAETGRTFSFDSRFWLNSNGFSISVPAEVPLYVDVDPPAQADNRQLCLTAKVPKGGPHSVWMSGRLHRLNYRVCYANEVTNLTQFYLDVLPSVAQLAPKVPDASYLTGPVWSTWPALGTKPKLDQSKLLEFVKQIRDHVDVQEPDRSVLRLGRGWESCMGELQFGSTNFPDPNTLLERLKTSRFNVLLRAHPFVGSKCESVYREVANRMLLVRKTSPYGSIATSNLENEQVASVDFTDTSPGGGAEWWRERLLQARKKFGVHGFYFEYGQAFYLGNDASLSVNPNEYSRNYAEEASRFGDMGSVGVGVGSARYAMFAEMQKRSMATWDATGIRGVIPGVLQMGLAGYPFVLPDPIGGGDATTRPDPRLYVRWLQLATFMPSMHFSWGFWSYEDDVVKIAVKMIELRKKFNATIVGLADTAARTGVPMVRPLWWIAPDDQRALQVDDQFMLGNDIMVAPIVTEADVRDVYLPKGTWNNMLADRPELGPKWIRNAKVELDQLLYFIRIAN